MTDYTVIYEQAGDGSWNARAVDLPVYSVANTRQEAAESIREAIAFYLEEGNQPESQSEVGTVTLLLRRR